TSAICLPRGSIPWCRWGGESWPASLARVGLLQDAVFREHLTETAPFRQLCADAVLAGRLLQSTREGLRCQLRGNHDNAIDVGEDPVAGADHAIADADRLIVMDAVEAALGVQRREAGREHREVHCQDSGHIARQAIDDST